MKIRGGKCNQTETESSPEDLVVKWELAKIICKKVNRGSTTNSWKLYASCWKGLKTMEKEGPVNDPHD